jgi:hypothetical protein
MGLYLISQQQPPPPPASLVGGDDDDDDEDDDDDGAERSGNEDLDGSTTPASSFLPAKPGMHTAEALRTEACKR